MRKVEVRKQCGHSPGYSSLKRIYLKKGNEFDFPHGNDDLFELGDGNDEAVDLGVPYFQRIKSPSTTAVDFGTKESLAMRNHNF